MSWYLHDAGNLSDDGGVGVKSLDGGFGCFAACEKQETRGKKQESAHGLGDYDFGGAVHELHESLFGQLGGSDIGVAVFVDVC